MPRLKGQFSIDGLGGYDRAVVMGYNPNENDEFYFFRHEILPYIDPLPYDRAFYISSALGQPPTDTRTLVAALLLWQRSKQPLQEFADILKRDIGYQYALDITHSSDVIPSYSALRVFKGRIENYYDHTGIDLIHDTFVQLSRHICDETGANTDDMRIDSFLLEIKATELSRFDLIYVTLRKCVRLLDARKVELPEELKHFLDPADYNIVTYHDTDTSDETKMERLLREASLVMSGYTEGLENTKEYKNLRRCLHEQTLIDDKGKRCLRQKGDPVLKGKGPADGEDPTITSNGILQTPVDPEATYNGKRGEKHRGYCATVTEVRSDRGPILFDYAFEPNNVGDNKMASEIASRLEHSEHGGNVVGDAGFSGDLLRTLVEQSGRTLVNTNLSGRKTKPFFSEAEFAEDGMTVTRCPGGLVPMRTKVDQVTGGCDCWFEIPASDPGNDDNESNPAVEDGSQVCTCCSKCPFYKDCNPKQQKKAFKRRFSFKMKARADAVRERSSEKFSLISAFRNGIEALGSLLRRLGVDRFPVYGKDRFRIRFGLMLNWVNLRKYYLRMVHPYPEYRAALQTT